MCAFIDPDSDRHVPSKKPHHLHNDEEFHSVTVQHRETSSPHVPISTSSHHTSASFKKKPSSRAPLPGLQAASAHPGEATRAPPAEFRGAQREGSPSMKAPDSGRQEWHSARSPVSPSHTVPPPPSASVYSGWQDPPADLFFHYMREHITFMEQQRLQAFHPYSGELLRCRV